MHTDTEKEKLFTTTSVWKAIISLAVPTVISQLITVIYNMADTFFIGRLGDPNQAAAATLSMPLFMFLTAFANIFGIGGASLISRCLGNGNYEKAKRCSSFCIWACVAVSAFYGIIVIISRSTLLPLFGADKETLGFCSSYIFWTVGIGAVPTVLNTGLANLIRAEGYSKQAGFGVAFGGILNIILDPIFIFVFKMQITGAAAATMLSNVAATIYFFAFILSIREKSTVTPSVRYFTLKCDIVKEVLAVGLPSAIMTLMSTLSNTVLNKIISDYSNEAVAGMEIAKKIDLMAFAIAQGMTQGSLPLIGFNYSSGNKLRMAKTIKMLIVDCLIMATLGTGMMFVGATPITRCFINDAETVKYGQIFLRIVCLACPTTALNFLVITVFQAIGKKIQPLVLSLLRKGGLDIPLMLLFNRIIGIKGIAWATPIADLSALVISLLMVAPNLKKLKKSKHLK